MRYAGRGVTSVEERPLWNMPIVLIALLGLLCARSGAIVASWGWHEADSGERDLRGNGPEAFSMMNGAADAAAQESGERESW